MDPHGERREDPRVAPLAIAAVAIAAVAAALAAAWAFHLLVLRPSILADFEGRPPLSPLYAFWVPRPRLEALGFAALAALLAGFSPRLCDPGRTGRRAFALALGAAALLLPFALFLVREAPGALGANLDVYANEEFLHDARRIRSLPGFLERYVELMPGLSLHGRHFPPGHAAILHLTGRLFGMGPHAAGLLALLAASAGVLLAWLAIERAAARRSAGAHARNAARADAQRAARQGALLLLAAPSFLDFACTSMDAVFLPLPALAALLALRGTPKAAFLAGAALLAAAFFSFSALPAGLFVGLLVLRTGGALRRLAALAAGFALSAILLESATGFSLLDCLVAARGSARELMTRAAGADPSERWAVFSLGNLTAFALGAGLALAPAVLARLRAVPLLAEPWTPATFLALAAMGLGGIYFLETERVWLFALPWLAGAAVSAGAFADSTLRLLLACGLAQALAMEIGLFTLW